MKRLYSKQIFFEGHQRFMKLLYFMEFEKQQIDLREKKHNFYVQGKMARERKYDPEKMAEILDQRENLIDEEFGGTRRTNRHKRNLSEDGGSSPARLKNINSLEEDSMQEFKAALSRKHKGNKVDPFSRGGRRSVDDTNDMSAIIDQEQNSSSSKRADSTTRAFFPGTHLHKQGTSKFKLKPMSTKYLIVEGDQAEE